MLLVVETHAVMVGHAAVGARMQALSAAGSVKESLYALHGRALVMPATALMQCSECSQQCGSVLCGTGLLLLARQLCQVIWPYQLHAEVDHALSCRHSLEQRGQVCARDFVHGRQHLLPAVLPVPHRTLVCCCLAATTCQTDSGIVGACCGSLQPGVFAQLRLFCL